MVRAFLVTAATALVLARITCDPDQVSCDELLPAVWPSVDPTLRG